MTFNIRSFSEKDLPVLVKLLNDTYKEAHEFAPYTLDDISSQIREGNFTILVSEQNGKVVGVVAYRSSHWGEEITWLTVAKKPEHKIIANKLVSEIEKHVKGETVFTVVDEESPQIKDWMTRGYKIEGGLYHMMTRLDSVKPLLKIPEGITMRSLKPNEEKEFVDVVNAGFGWERVQQGIIERWKNEHVVFDEKWIHVAEYESRIISIVVAKPDTEYNRFFGAKRGYLGPATTRPEHRGKNLASALTRRAMNFLIEKGFDSAALYTAEQNLPSVTLLKKLGFEIGHHWKFMRKSLLKP